MTFVATMLEPLTESLVLSIMGATSLWWLWGVPPWVSWPLHYIVWLAVDLDVYASLAGHPLPEGKRMDFFCAWSLREILALPIWVIAIVGSEVEWRGKTYQVLRDGAVRRTGESSQPEEGGGVSRTRREKERA